MMREFVEEVIRRWGQECGGRVEYITQRYLEQWTERRQSVMMEEIEKTDRMPSMWKAESGWEKRGKPEPGISEGKKWR
jgi:hypothetical protein